MSILLLGVDHQHAPLSVIESLAVPGEQLPAVLHELDGLDHVLEAAVVSTCNRVEVYVDLARFHDGYETVIGWLADRADTTVELLEPHVTARVDEQAAAHLFGVAGGLDSMVVGEQQIAMQVKAAMERARAEGTAGRMLQRLFRQAVRVGRRVRRETDVTDGASSMVDVGIAAAQRRLGQDLTGLRTLVVGAGAVGALSVVALGGHQPGSLAVWNRHPDKAERLAGKVPGATVAPRDLAAALREVDLVVCTTGAPEPVLDLDLLRAEAVARDGRRLVLLDLAVPRNVDPAADALPGVAIVDVSTVREAADRGVTGEVIDEARVLVHEEADRFRHWLRTIEVEPAIRALRSRAERVRAEEVERFSSRLGGLDDDQRRAVEALTEGIVNTLLHTPTVELKRAADAGAERHVAALVDLFALDVDEDIDGTGDARDARDGSGG